MAAVTVINPTVYGFTTPSGPNALPTYTTGFSAIIQCYFACNFAGTYVQGTGYSLSWANDIIVAINAVKRDGGTIKLWDVSAVAAALEGTTTPAVVMPGACVNTSGTATTGLLYGPDGATEHAAATLGVFSRPAVFAVTFLDTSLGA